MKALLFCITLCAIVPTYRASNMEQIEPQDKTNFLMLKQFLGKYWLETVVKVLHKFKTSEKPKNKEIGKEPRKLRGVMMGNWKMVIKQNQ